MTARRTRRKQAEPASTGLAVEEVADARPPAAVAALEESIAAAGGRALARYRDPLGGSWLCLAVLPLERVAPTPFQRDLSDAHVKRLADVIQKVGIYVDPIVAVPAPDSVEDPVRFWSPNGYHRLSALQRLGARSITALISPEPALAYRILALNTEKAHSVKERALEAVRMARGLAEAEPGRKESAYALELEEGALVTLGLCYEERPRFAGGAYAPTLRASDVLLDEGIAAALERRAAWAGRLLAIDERVAEIIAALKERGFESPYLRNFVVARIRPFRPRGKAAPEMEDLLEHLESKAAKFNTERVKPDQVSKAAGPAEAE